MNDVTVDGKKIQSTFRIEKVTNGFLSSQTNLRWIIKLDGFNDDDE
jgi:hypothetical protein